MKKVIDSRKISAAFPQKLAAMISFSSMKPALGIFIVTFLVSLTLTLSYLCVQTVMMYSKEAENKEEVVKNLSYWEKVTLEHPQFPAAYYKAAVYAVELNQTQKALQFLNKALFLDPNFFEAEVLAKEIEKN